MSVEKKNRLTVILFIIYLVLLSWIIVFKMQLNLDDLGSYRNINLIPFKESVIVNERLQMSEILENILAFVPFGVYLSMLNPEEGMIKRILPIFFVSLTYEVMQYVLAVGASDITDLIDNTVGGAIGVVVFMCFEKLLKEKTVRVLNILAACGTACLVALLVLLAVANM